jgi:hypothetical protein
MRNTGSWLIYFCWLAVSMPLVAAEKRTPVIVELFTSEGCSSCPPADKLLREFDDAQPITGVQVIVLGEHVDYWNHGGWMDRFSSPQWSQRQNTYAQTFRLDSAYTPQVVVDGRMQLEGNDARGVREAIVRTARERKDVRVELSQDGHFLNIQVQPQARLSEGFLVLLAFREAHLSTKVAGGENGGRTLYHAPVVRQLQTLGAVSKMGFAQQVPIPSDMTFHHHPLDAVVFVQHTKTREVIGASSLTLHSLE